MYEYDVVEVFISFDKRYDKYFEYELSPFGVRFLGIIDNPTLSSPLLTLIEPNFDFNIDETIDGYNASIIIDVTNIENFSLENILFNCYAIDVENNKHNLYALNPTLCGSFHMANFLSELEY